MTRYMANYGKSEIKGFRKRTCKQLHGLGPSAWWSLKKRCGKQVHGFIHPRRAIYMSNWLREITLITLPINFYYACMHSFQSFKSDSDKRFLETSSAICVWFIGSNPWICDYKTVHRLIGLWKGLIMSEKIYILSQISFPSCWESW